MAPTINVASPLRQPMRGAVDGFELETFSGVFIAIIFQRDVMGQWEDNENLSSAREGCGAIESVWSEFRRVRQAERRHTRFRFHHRMQANQRVTSSRTAVSDTKAISGVPALAFARLSHPTLFAPFRFIPTRHRVDTAPVEIVLALVDKTMK